MLLFTRIEVVPNSFSISVRASVSAFPMIKRITRAMKAAFRLVSYMAAGRGLSIAGAGVGGFQMWHTMLYSGGSFPEQFLPCSRRPQMNSAFARSQESIVTSRTGIVGVFVRDDVFVVDGISVSQAMSVRMSG